MVILKNQYLASKQVVLTQTKTPMYQQHPVRSYSGRISNILVYGLIAERGCILLVGCRSKIVENGKIGRTPF